MSLWESRRGEGWGCQDLPGCGSLNGQDIEQAGSGFEEKTGMEEISLALAGIMAMCAMAVYRKQGHVRSIIIGVGFFVVSCYIDGIFRIIMENGAGDSWKIPLQGVGIFISKSMMLVLLIVLETLRRERQGAGRPCESAGRGSETICQRARTCSGERLKAAGDQLGKMHLPQGKLYGGAQEGVRANSGSLEENQRGWGYMDGLTLGVSLFFGILAWWGQGVGEGSADFNKALFSIFLLAALLGFYIFCWFYRGELGRKTLQSECNARRAETDMYLEGVENHYEMTRELWHDLKNHLNLLNLLLQEGKHEQMADYLRILGEDVDSLTLPIKSGNLVVDALLADKAARAKRERIQVEVSLCDLTSLTLRPHEICGLLGNLLDNALEANLQVKEGRFLRVTCRDRSGWYYVKVENALGKKPEREGAGTALESGKTDRRNRVGHGLGLRSAERIVHGCGGDMVVESGEGCFTVAVRLPKE